MKTRRVKQISTSFTKDREAYSGICVIVAVCDDGTIWRMMQGEGYKGIWLPVEDIPQTPIPPLTEGTAE